MKLILPTPTKRTIVAFLIMLLFVGVYAFGIWYVRHLKAAAGEKSSELAIETTRERSLRNFGGFLAEVAEDATTLDSFFVTPDAAVTAIEQTEALGALLGVPVTISNVRITDENEATGEGTMFMDVSAEGSWSAIIDLATLLDTFPYASRADFMNVNRIAEATSEGPAVWRLRTTMMLWLRQ